MLFGEKSDFAVEAASDRGAASPPGHVWGHMRVWCRGECFGRFEEAHCGLDHAHEQLLEIANDLENMRSAELSGMDPNHAFERVHEACYTGSIERPLRSIKGDILKWGRFDFLTNTGEMFNGVGGVIFRLSDGLMRILLRDDAHGTHCFDVTIVGFRDAVKKFHEWHRTESDAA